MFYAVFIYAGIINFLTSSRRSSVLHALAGCGGHCCLRRGRGRRRHVRCVMVAQAISRWPWAVSLTRMPRSR
ncbi:MAG: hypothetical protein ACLT98_17985 [Eggerthellaceae bacterium]